MDQADSPAISRGSEPYSTSREWVRLAIRLGTGPARRQSRSEGYPIRLLNPVTGV